MSSQVEQIINAMSSEILAVTTGYQWSKFVYDFGRNNQKSSKKVYGIRPGDYLTVPGTNLSLTVDQTFEVKFSSQFVDKNDGDSNLQNVIYGLYEDQEKVALRLFHRRLGLNYCMLISRIDFSAPEIDNDNNIVTLTGSYTVKYRLEA